MNGARWFPTTEALLPSCQSAARERRQTGWAILIVAALAILPYVRVLPAYFVSDDFVLLPPYATSSGSFVSFAWRAITRLEAVPTTFYRPLPFIVFWSETRIWGVRPEGFHATNVLLHGGTTVLVFLLARRLLADPQRSLAAGLAAVSFALFPRRVEAVAWISSRPDLMATFFATLSALACLESARRERVDLLALATIAFWGALLSKESAALMPLALFVLPALASALGNPMPRPRRHLLWLGPIALSMAVYPFLRRLAIGAWVGGYAADSYDFRWRNLTFPAKYLVYSVLPPLDLAPQLTHTTFARAAVALCLLVLFGSLALIIVRRRHCHGTHMAVLWIGAACLPVLGFSPSLTTTFNDRFLYLPGVGTALLVASALSGVTRRALWLLAVPVVVTYGTLTLVVVERWRMAGVLTAALGVGLAERLANVPGDAPIYVAAVPDSLAGAYVLRNGLRELATLAGGTNAQRLTPLTYYFLEGPPKNWTPVAPVVVNLAPDGIVVESRDAPAVILAPFSAAPAANAVGQNGSGPASGSFIAPVPPKEPFVGADRMGRRQYAQFVFGGAASVWTIDAAGVQAVR